MKDMVLINIRQIINDMTLEFNELKTKNNDERETPN